MAKVVYRDFDEKKHFVTKDEVPELTNYFAGVDWGYEHSGVIQVWGETDDHNIRSRNMQL